VTQLIPLARSGVSYAACAAYVRITAQTLELWRRRGREAAEQVERGERIRHPETKYLDLYRALEKARAEFEIELLIMMRRVGVSGASHVMTTTITGNDVVTRSARSTRVETQQQKWQAIAWLLERVLPEKFARRFYADGSPVQPIDEPSEVTFTFKLDRANANEPASLPRAADPNAVINVTPDFGKDI
jgi:hypothetical protein